MNPMKQESEMEEGRDDTETTHGGSTQARVMHGNSALSRRVLLAEKDTGGGEHGCDAAVLEELVVPVSRAVSLQAASTPAGGVESSSSRLVPIDDGAPVPAIDGPIFELVNASGGEELVVYSHPGGRVRINALPAPLVALLRTGDIVRTRTGTALHVSALQGADAAAPTPEQVGQLCSLCMTPIEADSRVFVCACGNDLRHLEGDDVPDDDRLTCAHIAACASCGAETPTEPGFVYWPED
jgi:hypothetical protein